jgi:mono/diheme cytochrome c family protein
MRFHRVKLALAASAALVLGAGVYSCATQPGTATDESRSGIEANARQMLDDGRKIFRFDTFGSEAFWGTTRLHEALAGEKNGGTGPGVSPNAALKLGLKVDLAAMPNAIVPLIQAGTANLDDPAVTLALLKANAVVGVTGFFDTEGKRLTAVGIQCALCHSTVDDTLKPGIGRRLDGWPNRDLDIGAIVASAPDLSVFAELLQVDQATVRKVLRSWGPGKYDAQLNLDGKAFRPDGKPAATLNPPAFGLAGVNNHTWTGAWGNVTYWNAYVANTQMYGTGTFFDPRLDDPKKYPVAARAKLGHKKDAEDRITAKLAPLHFYQLALPTPKPAAGSFDAGAAQLGKALFNGKARCAGCHVPPLYTEPGWNLRKPEEIGIDDFQAKRSPDERYRTTPLRALWETSKIHKGGYYHDGRFATLREVVDHYDRHLATQLSEREKAQLIEFLKSI